MRSAEFVISSGATRSVSFSLDRDFSSRKTLVEMTPERLRFFRALARPADAVDEAIDNHR